MLSHVDAAGRAAMVDVSVKAPTRREAAVRAWLYARLKDKGSRRGI